MPFQSRPWPVKQLPATVDHLQQSLERCQGFIKLLERQSLSPWGPYFIPALIFVWPYHNIQISTPYAFLRLENSHSKFSIYKAFAAKHRRTSWHLILPYYSCSDPSLAHTHTHSAVLALVGPLASCGPQWGWHAGILAYCNFGRATYLHQRALCEPDRTAARSSVQSHTNPHGGNQTRIRCKLPYRH